MRLFSRAFQNTQGSSPESAEPRPGSRKMNDRLRANLNLPLRSATKEQKTPDLPTPTSPVPDTTPTLNRLASRNGGHSRQGSISTRGNTRQGPGDAALWGSSRLELHELAELFEEIHHSMSHCRYAIAGIGALIDAGFSGRAANKVTVVCPEECKDVIRGWAMTSSGVSSTSGTAGAAADSVSLRIRDGSLRRVRIRWLTGDDFKRLEIVRSTISNARVLGLASQVDQIATAWARARAQPHPDAAKQARETAVIVGDLFWCLRRAAELEVRLDPEYLPLFLSEAVWTPFTHAHADARFRAQRAGIDVAAVLRGHRERDDLRAHEALLRQYGETMGAEGLGAAGEAPRGPFEGLRHLGSTISDHAPARDGIASIYTVATDEARSELGSAPAAAADPPPPQPGWSPSPGMLRRTKEWLSRSDADEAEPGDGPARQATRRTPVVVAAAATGSLKRSLTRKPPSPVRQFSVGRTSTELSRRSVDMVLGRGTPAT